MKQDGPDRDHDATNPPPETGSTRSQHDSAGAPLDRRIGPYRLIRTIGEGGMGIVYEAEQETPIRRRVALKIIKHGLDGKSVTARFEAERQALALMKHPSIAGVLDAGADADGRPYFVMELIQGVPITDYCDRHNLSPDERLELMIHVCDGVHHAHQKGIIHRDIKPSNILVELRDGKPSPRIIDFGVAKAIDRRLTEQSHFTEFGQVIGTPEYMSPEQAEMTGLDIDTRTDVYSLGVLLYELLVGSPPFDPRELRRAGYDEMRRRIREETPAKPSTRISSLGATSADVARHRSADPVTLVRQCRGDLDWITMKALEKDRTRRYSSAAEFAADLRHHLANEPVIAGPPSVTYRAGKFMRRHRIGVAFATLLAAAVLVGLAGTTYGMFRALRAEKQARLEAETVREVADFMQEMFEINNPSEARGRSITAKEVLDRGAARIRGELADQPELQARLMESMGTVYRSLGLYEDSLPLLEATIAGLERAHGAGDPRVARVQTTLAGLLILKGRTEEALKLLNAALAVQEKALEPFDPELARTLNNMGNAYRVQKKYKEALPYMERALAIREKALGHDDLEVAKQLNNLGSVRDQLEDAAGAQRDLERALAIREKALGPDDLAVAAVLDSLATLYRRSGDPVRAKGASERALMIEEKVQGPEHPALINTLVNLGILARSAGDLAASEALLRRALTIAQAKLEPGQRDHRTAAIELAGTLKAEGNATEAQAVLSKADR